MKTKEVIKELEKMKLQAEIRINNLFVVHSGREDIASVNLNTRFEINTDYWAFKNLLAEDEQEKVYVLLTKLAETDPKDREEEKKYHLRHRWFADVDYIYVNRCISENSFLLHNNKNAEDYKTQFTQAEIDEIKRKFNTTLEDFEMVEVEDDR